MVWCENDMLHSISQCSLLLTCSPAVVRQYMCTFGAKAKEGERDFLLCFSPKLPTLHLSPYRNLHKINN